MTIEELKSEIDRAYCVLGERAETQNLINIKHWESIFLIDKEQAKVLRKYNRMVSKSYE